MKTVTLPLEFVKEAHKAACNDWKHRIEEHLPELFKDEVDQWHINRHNRLWFVKKISNGFGYGYGFDSDGNWAEESKGYNYSLNRKATDQEVEDALINEAKNRGFKEGAFLKSLRLTKWKIGSNSYFEFKENNLRIWGDHISEGKIYTGYLEIFKNGKWTELIENPIPKSLQKAIDKLGKEKILEYLK